jgi:hypothetical protein
VRAGALVERLGTPEKKELVDFICELPAGSCERFSKSRKDGWMNGRRTSRESIRPDRTIKQLDKGPFHRWYIDKLNT